MDVSRRSFFKFLGAAPVALAIEEAFNPHRVIFDMGKNVIWTPPALEIRTAQLGDYVELGPQLDEAVKRILAMYGEKIADEFFQPSPTFEALINGNREQRYVLPNYGKQAV